MSSKPAEPVSKLYPDPSWTTNSAYTLYQLKPSKLSAHCLAIERFNQLSRRESTNHLQSRFENLIATSCMNPKVQMRSRGLCSIHTEPESWCDLLRVLDTQGPCLFATRHCNNISSSRVTAAKVLSGLTLNSMVPFQRLYVIKPGSSICTAPGLPLTYLYLMMCIVRERGVTHI